MCRRQFGQPGGERPCENDTDERVKNEDARIGDPRPLEPFLQRRWGPHDDARNFDTNYAQGRCQPTSWLKGQPRRAFAYSGTVVNRLSPPAVSRRALVGLAAGAAGAAFASGHPAAASLPPLPAVPAAPDVLRPARLTRRRRRAGRSGERDVGADRRRHRRGHADGAGPGREARRASARPPWLARRQRSRSRRRRDGDVHGSLGEGGAPRARRLGVCSHPAASRLRRHQAEPQGPDGVFGPRRCSWPSTPAPAWSRSTVRTVRRNGTRPRLISSLASCSRPRR